MIDILAFGAHPDDIEFGCGGILAKAASEGKKIILADLTLGEKGTRGNAEIRRKEGEAAARVIHSERIFLNFSDCEVMDNYEGRLELVKVIRKYKPKLVLAPMWKGEQTHPDHVACGLLARHACRYSRFAKILPELPIHRPDGILHYLFPLYEHPDFLIDISEHLETWKQMMQCHESQLQTHSYSEWNLRVAARLGLAIGTEYAQGLGKGNAIAIDDIMSVSKGTREI